MRRNETFREDSDSRRLVFQVENVDVEIRLSSSAGGWMIIGQVLSVDGRLLPPLTIRLFDDGHLRQTATTNYIGEFNFMGVSSVDALSLEVELPDGRIIGGFEVE